jgi:hypothetical protein
MAARDGGRENQFALHRERRFGDLRDCWAVNRAIALTVSPHTDLVTEAW